MLFDRHHNFMVVREEGYAYIFVSNENPTKVDIHFDDLKITHTKTNVIQYSDYYPFGLQTSASWTRENTKDNNFLYNAANELNKTSGWYEMYYRGYDPAIGRMLQIDPYATMYAPFSTYNYALNNPVMMNDPNGGQVDVTGLTDSQVRSLYRANMWRGSYSNFDDWASDNVTGTSLDGSYFGSAAGGRWASFEYRYFYTDGVEAEWKRHVEREWVPDQNELTSATLELLNFDAQYEHWLETANYRSTSTVHGQTEAMVIKTAVVLFYDKKGKLTGMIRESKKYVNEPNGGTKVENIDPVISEWFGEMILGSILYHDPETRISRDTALGKYFKFLTSSEEKKKAGKLHAVSSAIR